MNILLHSFEDGTAPDLSSMQIGGIRKGWLGYSMAVVAGIGFLAGVSALGIKKPGFRQTNMTPEEYYRYAAVVPPPPQEVGIFDDILEREYFSPGLVKKAFAGDAESQYWLAWCYNAKNATSAQQAEAAYWYLQAARQGHPQAENVMGEFYLRGIGVPQSDREAVSWFKKSALKGNSWAAYLLGECYLRGRGVEPDLQEGIRWLKQGSGIYRGARERLRSLGIQPPPSPDFPKEI